VRSILTILGILAMALAADAQERTQPSFEVRLRRDVYVATVDLARVFNAALREKIDSGLTTRIVLRAQVLDAEDKTVKSLSVVEYRILYRVWEEDYVVRRWDAMRQSTYRLRRYGDVLRRVARQKSLPVAGREDLVPGRRYVAVLEVDVDPISEELLERVREYLANPGGHRREGGGRGLFGNLARIFFDARSGPSPSAVELRSAAFVARER
jgi:hypothetical protein